jgi:uncharacterized UBP type Zn finger protein
MQQSWAEVLFLFTGPTDQVGAAADEAIVAQLATMGFPRLRCEKAAIQTSNTGLEEAMTWLLAHMDDPGRLFQHISLITLF